MHPRSFTPDRVRSTTLCILVLRILRLHLDCHLLTCMPITAMYLHIQHRQASPRTTNGTLSNAEDILKMFGSS